MPKIGKPVLEVFRSKHPRSRPPMASSFEAYRIKPPAFVSMYITDKTVASVAIRMSGAAGPRGTDLVSLQHWILQFGAVSAGLWHIFGEFRYWVVNRLPPWVAYRALMLGRLVGLNNFPSVRPVGVGETWQ